METEKYRLKRKVSLELSLELPYIDDSINEPFRPVFSAPVYKCWAGTTSPRRLFLSSPFQCL